MTIEHFGIRPFGLIPSIKPTMDKKARITHLIEYHEQIIRNIEQELAKE